MDKKLVTKWVKALESGKYPQAEGSFYKEVNDDDTGSVISSGYCCLGVADLVCFGVQNWSEDKGEFGDELGDSEKMDKLGLTVEIQDKLITFNDGSGGEKKRTFKYIAKWIRRNILGEMVRVR